MRAVASIALATLALATPAAALAGLQTGAPCKPARDQSYQNHGYVCVKVGGRFRLAQIVAAPARPGQPRVRPLHRK